MSVPSSQSRAHRSLVMAHMQAGDEVAPTLTVSRRLRRVKRSLWAWLSWSTVVRSLRSFVG